MLALPVTIAIALAAADALAQTPGTINVCVKHDDGQMRLVPAPPCKGNETLYVLNQQGPAGQAGPQGQQGPVGPAGPGLVMVAADNAVLHGMPNAEFGYALVPVNSAGDLAAVPMRLADETTGGLAYKCESGKAGRWFESSGCNGPAYIVDRPSEPVDASFGATRRSVLEFEDETPRKTLLVARNEPGSLRTFNSVFVNRPSDESFCLQVPIPGRGWLIEYEIDLNAAYPGPILPLLR
jgi:hypothetical protein